MFSRRKSCGTGFRTRKERGTYVLSLLRSVNAAGLPVPTPGTGGRLSDLLQVLFGPGVSD